MRRLVLAAVAASLAIAAGGRLGAHDIPRDVIVHAFLKPEGNRLRVLVRAPLGAMRDIQFPRDAAGNLDAGAAGQQLQDAVALWIAGPMEIREAGTVLPAPAISAVRVSLPSDRSFSSYPEALAHTTQAAPEDPRVPWDQAMLDVLLEYPIASESSRFAIRPGFERLGNVVITVLGAVQPDGAIRPFALRGDPGLVQLDPRWHEAAWRFVTLGFVHILEGVDHLLFLLCLVIPFRRLKPLILVVTAFTAAHSVALIGAAFGYIPEALWFQPLVETLIAASVFYMAIENIVSDGAPRRRTFMAFGFGLVHGFGFSFALQETMQFAGSHLVASLFAFNIGVELGQILVLLILVPALGLVFTRVMKERIGTIVLSAIAAHVAWHWMADRWSALSEFPMPAAGTGTALFLVRAAIVVVVLLAAYRGLRAFKSREQQTAP